MYKLSHFFGQTEHGIHVFPLFGKADQQFEKTASDLLPEVSKYIAALRPTPNAQYVLVNAMGASEFYSSNVNGDAFPEASLIHMPDNWSGVPAIDKIVSKNWGYGFPTFYNAHAYGHHRNKDSSKAYGDVELATWNPKMRRVELVIRVDHDKCLKFGGTGVWDKLRIGEYIDVSMGSKVPYDTCSICLDWDAYRKAIATFEPKRHIHPGAAALEYHKKLKADGGKGIRGLSVTRNDYCEHAKKEMSRIYPDGRKVFVYNDYPRFFDISFVFIGADRTAKTMLFIVSNGKVQGVKPSAQVAEEHNLSEPEELDKAASVDDELLKAAFGKLAKPKAAEISKDVPSRFARKVVPLLTKHEASLPTGLIDQMGGLPFEDALATSAGMGILLRPQEFQRLSLVRLGKKALADKLDSDGQVFSKTEQSDPVGLAGGRFSSLLADMLSPFLAGRSGLAPSVEKRVLIIAGTTTAQKHTAAPSHSSELLDKISSAYNGYRHEVLDFVACSKTLLESSQNQDLKKVASVELEEMFTPLSVSYLQHAFMDEFGITGAVSVKLSTGEQPAWRGVIPSKNTW